LKAGGRDGSRLYITIREIRRKTAAGISGNVFATVNGQEKYQIDFARRNAELSFSFFFFLLFWLGNNVSYYCKIMVI